MDPPTTSRAQSILQQDIYSDDDLETEKIKTKPTVRFSSSPHQEIPKRKSIPTKSFKKEGSLNKEQNGRKWVTVEEEESDSYSDDDDDEEEVVEKKVVLEKKEEEEEELLDVLWYYTVVFPIKYMYSFKIVKIALLCMCLLIVTNHFCPQVISYAATKYSELPPLTKCPVKHWKLQDQETFMAVRERLAASKNCQENAFYCNDANENFRIDVILKRRSLKPSDLTSVYYQYCDMLGLTKKQVNEDLEAFRNELKIEKFIKKERKDFAKSKGFPETIDEVKGDQKNKAV